MVEVAGRQQSQHKTIENKVRLLHTKQTAWQRSHAIATERQTTAKSGNIARTEHLKKT